jgi:thiol-disulfide isomerase/thioredoxin
MVTDHTSTPASPGPVPLSPRSHRRRGPVARAFAALALLALVATTGCSASTGSTGTSVSSGATTGQSSPFAHVGALPSTTQGAAFDAASLTGKPVVLWFWAPWCTICRAEAPTITKVAAEFAGKVEFVGIAGQGTKSAMSAFVEQTGTGNLPHLADTTGAVWREYGVTVQPSFAFITRDGRVDLRVGSLDEATLRARVAAVAAGEATSAVSLPPGPTCSRAPDGTLLCGSAGPGQPSTTIPPSPTSTS